MSISRREWLYRISDGLGSVAFSSLLAQSAGQQAHHGAKAKACIFLLMEGGASHIDTFDPKPQLTKLHMTDFARQDKFASAMESGKRYYVQSPFEFQRAGKIGIEVNKLFEHFSKQVDDVCFYRGCVAESTNHPTALYHLNTGNQFGGDPALGAWTTYGLGTLNRNLPGFVVLPDLMYPQGGAANWSNGYLPAQYQGAALRAAGSPVLDMNPPAGVTAELQRANLDLLAKLNQEHQAAHREHAELAARMETYELAFRMQAEMPGVIDFGRESKATLDLYGVDQGDTDNFGRRCLLARRMIEAGVRFVQLISSGWDSHDDILTAHGNRIRSVDKPVAGLLRDLKQRGLLDSTLVVWAGEFGRSPDNGVRRGAKAWGRDHNAKAMTVWLAGGGVRAGHIVGATDETGGQAVEVVHPLRNLHVTLLHLLGLDDAKLTYFHAGRFKQLSQVGGEVIRELLA